MIVEKEKKTSVLESSQIKVDTIVLFVAIVNVGKLFISQLEIHTLINRFFEASGKFCHWIKRKKRCLLQSIQIEVDTIVYFKGSC